jgi:hypothetical protein
MVVPKGGLETVSSRPLTRNGFVSVGTPSGKLWLAVYDVNDLE